MKLIHAPHGTLVGITDISLTTQPRREREKSAAAHLLKELTGKEVTIGHTTSGTPFVTEEPELNISISHSSRHVAIALNDSMPVGIDIEQWRDQLAKVAHKFLSTSQISEWESHEMLLRAWTIKEAVYKALCSGGYHPAPSLLPLPLPPDIPAGMEIHCFASTIPCEMISLSIITTPLKWKTLT